MNRLKHIVFTLTFLICGFALAQAPSTNLEIIAGPTISRVIGDDIEGVDMKFGLQGGLLINLPSRDGTIRVGALYNQKGFVIKQGINTPNIDITLNYLTIPVHFAFSTASGGQFYAGPEFNVLLNAKASDGTTSVEIEEGLNDVDLSIAAGIIIPFSDRVRMSFGVSLGLIKVLRPVGYNASDVGNNLSIPISLGLAL